VDDLVDIGANLTSKAFHGDLDGVLARARTAGVSTVIVTGTSAGLSQAAAELASQHGLFSTAGIHPHLSGQATPADYRRIADLLALSGVVAIGECGLDYHRNLAPRSAQLACFEAQLEMAAELAKPVFLHERDASADFIAVLRRYRARIPRAVVHCFTGDRQTLDAYLALDLHIGITGWICDERRGLHLRDLVPSIPADRLMLETDAPYLLPRNLPVPPSTRRNEPAFLPLILSTVAAALDLPPTQVAEATTATARTFFTLP
jgi:TatD DNase family protein